MGLRVAEIDQHAVAHVLRYEPAEALHGLGDALLVGGNDLAQVLRVHTRRERCRTDEVREHHRDMAALGGVSAGVAAGAVGELAEVPGLNRQALPIAATSCVDDRARRQSSRGLDPSRSGRTEKSMSVLGKPLRVLPETELLQPISDLLHRGSAPDYRASSARIGKTTRQIPSAVDAPARWQPAELQALRYRCLPWRGPPMRLSRWPGPKGPSEPHWRPWQAQTHASVC